MRTPSLLAAAELDILFSAIHKNYKVSTTPEITVEANPDDLTPEKLRELKPFGVNRLSIGIQSFDEAVLRFLNRAHTANEAVECVELARNAGIKNISIDLIYSIPGQPEEVLKKNLDKAFALLPTHISAYSLTIEEKTVFGKWAKQGKLVAMDDDKATAQFELVMDSLTRQGYQHYEISNYCLPGYESKHNTSYWQQKKYLGVGPSAHSFNTLSRQFNINNNHLYIKNIKEGKVPFEREILTTQNKINEYLFTSLRTKHGCSLTLLANQYGHDLLKVNDHYISQLLKKELITLTGDTIILTRAGKLLADQIASDLFITDDHDQTN